MPGAGTDKTRNWIETAGPVIVLVEPQLGENIGAAARVMANFGLGRLRLVKPRDGWPNIHAQRSASGADRILDDAMLFDDLPAAIADCTPFWRRRHAPMTRRSPCSARARRLLSWRRTWPRARTSPCCSGASAMASRTTRWRSPTASSRSRSIRRSRRSTWPRRSRSSPTNGSSLHPAACFPSPCRGNRSRRASSRCRPSSPISNASSMPSNIFDRLDKRATMLINLRNIFARMQPTKQDIQTLHGIVVALTEGRKGPARGGVLDGEEATASCADCWRNMPTRARRANAGPCAGWRGFFAAIRPTPTVCCGRRSPRTDASRGMASSGRSRSGCTSPISSHSRCAS